MKTKFSFLLFVLLLLGCNETPIQTEEPEDPIEPGDQTYELVTIPPRPVGTPTFSSTESIEGDHGGYIKIKESYVTEDGNTVHIDVKLKIKKDSFSGKVDITMTVDDVYAAVKFSPPMIFDKPVELDFKYEGLDPDQLNLTSGDYDFLYIDDDGNTESIPSHGVDVDQEDGEISVKKAKLSHFSRFAFAR